VLPPTTVQGKGPEPDDDAPAAPGVARDFDPLTQTEGLDLVGILSSIEETAYVWDIKSGRLDGTVADVIEVTGGFLSKPEGKDYGVVGPELYIPKYFGTGAGFALRKGETALKAELNDAIKTIRANGTYKKINDKYFKIDVYGK